MRTKECPHGCGGTIYIGVRPGKRAQLTDVSTAVPPNTDFHRDKCPHCGDEYYYWREEITE